MQIDLTGRTALVTGGAVGIGRGVVLALAAAGADVALTYHSHDGEQVASEVKELDRYGAAFGLDATDSAAVADVVARTAAGFDGRIDILVNNVGGLIARQPIAEMTDEHWHDVINVNLSSAFYCSRQVIAHMPSGGRIVNISSLAGRNGGGSGAVAYAAAKAGIHGMTRGLAKELGGNGITVNAVAPGLILDTPFHPAFTPPAEQEQTAASLPAGRAGYPRDVAGTVLYLVSAAGEFVSGAVIDLNGGGYFA